MGNLFFFDDDDTAEVFATGVSFSTTGTEGVSGSGPALALRSNIYC